MDHFTCALLGLIHFPPKTSHLGDPMHIFTFLCIRDDQFSKNLNFTTEGALKSKKLRKETMLEIEKYIKKHVGRKVLLTLTFSPSPNIYDQYPWTGSAVCCCYKQSPSSVHAGKLPFVEFNYQWVLTTG